MHALLDECLPALLAEEFSDSHRVETVPDNDWAGLSDGKLLARTEETFDFFITVDAGIEYERNLEEFNIGIILVSAPSNRLADLRPLVPSIESELIPSNRNELIQIS